MEVSETWPNPSDEERRAMIVEELARQYAELGYPAKDFISAGDRAAELASREAVYELERRGITVDSLDLIEAALQLEGNEDEDNEDGGAGDREPLNPLPNSNSSGAIVEQPNDS